MREHCLSINVQQKPVSRKMSWTLHATHEAAVRDSRCGESYRREYWSHGKSYRINIYCKAPLVTLCGPTGRVICQP